MGESSPARTTSASPRRGATTREGVADAEAEATATARRRTVVGTRDDALPQRELDVEDAETTRRAGRTARDDDDDDAAAAAAAAKVMIGRCDVRRRGRDASAGRSGVTTRAMVDEVLAFSHQQALINFYLPLSDAVKRTP